MAQRISLFAKFVWAMLRQRISLCLCVFVVKSGCLGLTQRHKGTKTRAKSGPRFTNRDIEETENNTDSEHESRAQRMRRAVQMPIDRQQFHIYPLAVLCR